MNFFFNFLVYFIQFKEKILLLIQNHAYYNIAMMIVIKQNAGEKGKFRHKQAKTQLLTMEVVKRL